MQRISVVSFLGLAKYVSETVFIDTEKPVILSSCLKSLLSIAILFIQQFI